MTVRHLNFTERQRIRRADVVISLEVEGDVPTFSVDFDLSDYELPDSAEIVVEAYADWTEMRFPFGTVGAFSGPPATTLTEFLSAEGIKFRLKVLGTGDNSGLILAEADGIRPSATVRADDTRSFVVVRPYDLGDVAWQFVIDQSQPVLRVNERIPDWHGFLRRAEIRALILPEVLRQLLLAMVERGVPEEGDSDGWISQCRDFAEAFGLGPPPTVDDEEEVENWVDGIVRKFARRHCLWPGVREFFDGASA